MKICSNCGEYLYSFVKTCPRCGYTFDCDSKSVNEIKNSVTEKPKTRVRTMSAKKAYALAKKYYNGDGVDEDLNKAFELFLIAAEKGHAGAQNQIGYMYAHGEGVRKNLDCAFVWYMKAAKKGQKDAQYEVGEAYYYEKGIDGSYRKAFNSYMKAAEQGHADAQYSVGFMYANGKGVKRDLEEAFHWFKQAAQQGHDKARYYVGEAYYYGEGTKESNKTAFRWYKQAAEQEHTDAQYALGYMYYHCQGVREDLGEAAFWLNKAAYNGSKEAKVLLKEVYENSTLYVYRGRIDCIAKHHQFVPATAVLLGKNKKKVESNVNFCMECRKLLIIKASYELYRKTHGFLIGDVKFDKRSNTDGKKPDPWIGVSPLYLSGYNVSAQEGLTARERQLIISKLLDKGVMTKPQIINYLGGLFIPLNEGKNNARAVKKWNEDLKFTNQYKINEQPKLYITEIKKLPKKVRRK